MESSVVVKTLKLLEAVAAEPNATLAELSERLEFSKPSAHRVLGDLVSLGYLQRSEKGRYRCTSAVWNFIPGAQARLLAVAIPVMQKVAKRTLETINLGELSGQSVRYQHVINSTLPLRREVTIGDSDPALTTALGRALLSQLPQVAQQRFLANPPRRQTCHTLTTASQLRQTLDSAAAEGYAVDNEETDLGVLCIAVPIYDSNGVRAALSLSLPTVRLEQHGGIESIAQLLKKASTAISNRLRKLASSRSAD